MLPRSYRVSLIGGLDSSLEYGTPGNWDWANVRLERKTGTPCIAKQNLVTYS